MGATMEHGDVQGLVFSGYGSRMAAASYHLLRVDDPARARAWLRGLADRVTPAVPDGAPTPGDVHGFCLNVAFTTSGLTAFGLGEADLNTFEPAFRDGMTSPRRTRILGDFGPSDPAGWDWGGPHTPAVDVLLLLYAPTGPALAAVEDRERQAYTAGGLSAAHPPIPATELVSTGPDAREHFGFADGVSQPEPTAIDSAEAWAAARAADPQAVPAGEFVLGYTNAYYGATAVPAGGAAGPAFGRNGTYLAVRHLRQDVAGFWTFLRDRAGGDPARAEWLAAKVVGRWPSGATVRPGDTVDPGAPAAGVNGFDYADDPYGEGVPVGAHVRRANPRAVGLADAPADSRLVADRHRLIRRGRNYGPRAADRFAADGSDRGLFFVAVNANLERQFEFVMHSWFNNPLFGGLYQETDPLVGDPTRIVSAAGGPAETSATTHSVPGDPVRRRIRDVPRFVTAHGGAYFFLPGLAALRALASG